MLATPTAWAGEDFELSLETPETTRKSAAGRFVVVPSTSTQWAAVRMCMESRIDPPQAPTKVFPFSSNSDWT